MKTNVLLLGEVGSGKTHSLRSVVTSAKMKLFVLATEQGIESLVGPKSRGGEIPCSEGCHYHYVSPAKDEWDTLISNAKFINTMGMDQLQKMSGMNKTKYSQFIEVLNALCNFKCDRCGEEFGPVDEFEEDCFLAVDGLTGLSQMAMDLTVGAKPIKTQPEWGAAMDTLHRLIKKLTSDLKCSFVLISHITREKDEVSGGSQIMVSTLGNKLAPEIPKPFDEVVLALRDGDEFRWSTTASNTLLKARVLPWSDNISPDFAQFFSN